MLARVLGFTCSALVAAIIASPDAGAQRGAPDAGAPEAIAPRASTSRADAGDACPDGMALVSGSACGAVRQVCAEWVEPPSIAKDGRCQRFAQPSVCTGARTAMRFCIDRDEYPGPGKGAPETHKPMTTVAFVDAERICKRAKKRLCRESEWTFACEGEAMLPYPTGYERPTGRCNFDQMRLVDARGAVIDHRKPSASLTDCTSPFGVRNMVGNVDEWTERDASPGPFRDALKGGWWLAGRNRCRPATTAHSEVYRDFQTGFRCCSEAPQ